MSALAVDTTDVLTRTKWQGKKVNIVDITTDTGTYETGGLAITAAQVGLYDLEYCVLLDPNVGGYIAGFERSTGKITLTNPVSAHTHVFTGTAPTSSLNMATPAFSGTGLTASGQVMTTTDNQTMTLNQCAGMWLVPATGSTAPMLILSNTAVTAAPAVLTVQGSAATDAGAYKIVKNVAVAGTVAANTVAAGSEVANGTAINPALTFTVIAIGI